MAISGVPGLGGLNVKHPQRDPHQLQPPRLGEPFEVQTTPTPTPDSNLCYLLGPFFMWSPMKVALVMLISVLASEMTDSRCCVVTARDTP